MNTLIRGTASLILVSTLWLIAGCTNTQVDSGNTDVFTRTGASTYQWKYEPVLLSSSGDDSAAAVGQVFRQEVDAALSAKGYREVTENPDFLVSIAFRTSIEEGALPGAENTLGARAVANRGPDPGSMDNAMALSGPREMNNALLQFEASSDGQLLWEAVMSRVVENSNQNSIDAEAVRRDVRRSLRRATEVLPEVSP